MVSASIDAKQKISIQKIIQESMGQLDMRSAEELLKSPNPSNTEEPLPSFAQIKALQQ